MFLYKKKEAAMKMQQQKKTIWKKVSEKEWEKRKKSKWKEEDKQKISEEKVMSNKT